MAARALRRGAHTLDIHTEVRGDVAIAENDSAAVAMTLGVFRPLVLLPTHYRDWHPSRLRAVLLHELAHVRRRDCLARWLPQIVCALHWFNPLIWLARAQMLCESERACDDAVLNAGASGPDFARDLLAIAETSGLKGADPMLVTIATRLERRIARLLDASANRRPMSRVHALGTAAVVLVLLLPLAAVRAQAPGAQTGALSGVISDPSGAVIANAVVNLSGPAGKLAIAADPRGAWTAKNLAPGRYQIDVSVPGFVALRQLVDVDAGATAQVKQALTIGQVAERVTVVGAAVSRPAVTQAAPAQRIRVGGNIQAAKLISKTDPVYPDSARQQGLEGTVLIQAIIGKTGNIMDAHVLGNDTPQDLAQAALDAVRTWQYQPSRLNGEPVEVITTVTINFQLR